MVACPPSGKRLVATGHGLSRLLHETSVASRRIRNRTVQLAVKGRELPMKLASFEEGGRTRVGRHA